MGKCFRPVVWIICGNCKNKILKKTKELHFTNEECDDFCCRHFLDIYILYSLISHTFLFLKKSLTYIFGFVYKKI